MIVQASVAVSVDGYIDDLSDRRLVLSHAADWEEVRSLRAESDAILVGAETIRRDNPALVTRDERLRELRAERGLPADPVKVTLSRNADLTRPPAFYGRRRRKNRFRRPLRAAGPHRGTEPRSDRHPCGKRLSDSGLPDRRTRSERNRTAFYRGRE